MKLGLITIGSELLNGKIKDLNTFILSQFSQIYNFELAYSLAVKDEKEKILNTIFFMNKNCDVVIISGGLGPTKDDITKDILVSQFGDDFSLIKNHNGSAQGLYFKNNIKLFATPGVPFEFKMMLEKEIFPMLQIQTKKNNQVIFRTYKTPEAKIFNELCPNLWSELEKYGEVSSLPILGGVDIGVNLFNLEKRDDLIKTVLSSKLKDIIWHIGFESLEEIIIQKAKKKSLKIGFAESCTGGLLASKITDIAGSSSVFWGSIVSYANDIKIKSLNVKEETLKNFGAVSLQVAKEMAQGARDHLNVDIAIATTGIAGPGGATETKPVGTICIGVATKDKNESFIYQFKGDREILKERFAKAALFLLLENLD